MVIKLDGVATAAKVRAEAKDAIKRHDLHPELVIITVGDDAASSVYVKNKVKACEECGIECRVYKYEETIAAKDLIELIQDLNQDENVDGIMLQLPLPTHLDMCQQQIIDTIDPNKDVDGITTTNVGRLWNNDYWNLCSLTPCTAQGVMELLWHYGINIAGKRVAIISRSKIVGRPLAALLINNSATVTVCHSQTEVLRHHMLEADIVISAIGRPKYFGADDIKDGAIVIDVGINRDENGKLCGDFDFDSIKYKALAATPVPGGIGPMTVACLMKNVVEAARINRKNKQ